MNVDMKKLRDLALNGNGTASPYVPLLCSELLALLDEIHNQKFERDSAVANLILAQNAVKGLAAARDELVRIATGVVSSRMLQRVDELEQVAANYVATLRKAGR